MTTSEQITPPPGTLAPDRLYTFAEAGAVLGVSANYMKRAVTDGRIPCVRLNPRGVRRVRGRDLVAWMDSGGVTERGKLAEAPRVRKVRQR